MILANGDLEGESKLVVDGKSFRAEVAAMSPEAVSRLSGFFQSVRCRPGQEEKPVLKSLESELAKRGIALDLSGKVNNVYLSGDHAQWTVDANAGNDAGRDGKGNRDDAGAATRVSRRDGAVGGLGRFAKNFLLGH